MCMKGERTSLIRAQGQQSLCLKGEEHTLRTEASITHQKLKMLDQILKDVLKLKKKFVDS